MAQVAFSEKHSSQTYYREERLSTMAVQEMRKEERAITYFNFPPRTSYALPLFLCDASLLWYLDEEDSQIVEFSELSEPLVDVVRLEVVVP